LILYLIPPTHLKGTNVEIFDKISIKQLFEL